MAGAHPDAVGPHVVATHGHGLAELARRHAATTPVPTCGDWSLADLVWHLAEVHDFWAHTIEHRPAGPDTYSRPDRPPDDELAGLLDDRCERLVGLLAATDPDEHAWSWSAERSVRFTIRRQSHEALIHHVDGVLAVGSPLPAAPSPLAADGVDELVTVMLAGVPDWAEYHPSDRTLRLVATDTGDRWELEFGRMTGTSPDTGRTYDVVALEVLDRLDRPTTTISAPALELDLWMWGRADHAALTVTGDPLGASRLRELVVDTTQ